MANDDGMRAWFSRHVPKSRPSLLKDRNLCSAVSNGKGGDLTRFFDDAQIPKDKRSSLPREGRPLCSAVVSGKGGDLICFIYGRTDFAEKVAVAPGERQLSNRHSEGQMTPPVSLSRAEWRPERIKSFLSSILQSSP